MSRTTHGILITALLLSGCDIFQSTDGLSDDDLSNQVRINDFVLKISETSVENIKEQSAVFRIENSSSRKKIFGFNSGCQTAFTIEWEDEILFDSREGIFCTAALTSFTLKPGQIKEFNLDFSSPPYASRIEKIGNKRVGRYTLTTFLRDNQSPKVAIQFVVK